MGFACMKVFCYLRVCNRHLLHGRSTCQGTHQQCTQQSLQGSSIRLCLWRRFLLVSVAKPAYTQALNGQSRLVALIKPLMPGTWKSKHLVGRCQCMSVSTICFVFHIKQARTRQSWCAAYSRQIGRRRSRACTVHSLQRYPTLSLDAIANSVFAYNQGLPRSGDVYFHDRDAMCFCALNLLGLGHPRSSSCSRTY